MSDYKKDFKQFIQTAGEKLTESAKKGAELAKEKAPKAACLAKKGADKTAEFAKRNAPVVKDFAKSVSEELHDAGAEVKKFASKKIDAYKKRKNIKVYTSSDVIDYEAPSESKTQDEEE